MIKLIKTKVFRLSSRHYNFHISGSRNQYQFYEVVIR